MELHALFLADIQLTPFLGAVLIGWILSVCFHEFAHALVAYWGGDRSVRQRGYLSFNPFYYIHPVTSILLPCVFLMMGGIPLPGGAVLIDRASLRGPKWEASVAGAGPMANALLFGVIALLIHPTIGLIDASSAEPAMWARWLGVLAVLQVFAVLLNLFPIPPFDGFGLIEPFLDASTRMKLANPQFRWIGMILVVFVLFQSDAAMSKFMDAVNAVLVFAGLPWDATWRHFNNAF